MIMTLKMNSALKVLGMTNPFEPSKADFSALGSSDSGNIFISRVLHKAYIAVDEKEQSRCGDRCGNGICRP